MFNGTPCALIDHVQAWWGRVGEGGGGEVSFYKNKIEKTLFLQSLTL